MKIILCNSAEISEQQLLIYGNIRNFMQVKTLFSHLFTAKPQFQLLCYLFLLSFDFTAKPQCNNGANYFYFHLILLPKYSQEYNFFVFVLNSTEVETAALKIFCLMIPSLEYTCRDFGLFRVVRPHATRLKLLLSRFTEVFKTLQIRFNTNNGSNL